MTKRGMSMEGFSAASIIDRMAASVPRDTATECIGEDGLTYCMKCHGKRSTFIRLPGGVRRIVPCICGCMSAAYDAEEAQRKERQRMDEIRQNRRLGFADAAMMEHRFEADDRANPKVSDALMRYCENFAEFRKNGKGLLLYGDVGRGKTFYAAAIVNQLIDMGRPAILTTLERVVNIVNDGFSGRQERLDALTRYDLIALDEFVTDSGRFSERTISTAIDCIYRANVPMVITTNLSPRQMADDAGAKLEIRRIYDRLLERCFPIEVAGEDRRKVVGRLDYAAMKKALGM